jgi:DNA-binding transcriptional ArsR family regulator
MVERVEELVDDPDAVFRALADPGRRALLDALFEVDGQSLGALCQHLPEMTRFGVMKHLAVLQEAGLVVAFKHGRSKLHYLNPVPIQQLADRWMSKYARSAARSLAELKATAERDPST